MFRPAHLPWVVHAALVAAASATACAGAPQPSPDEAAFLAVGADPVAVIDEAAARLGQQGLSPTLRIDDARFSALATSSTDGRTAIRVATQRGLALALDATPDDLATLSLDPRTGSDLDGDGAGDVIIVRTEPARVCLALASIDAEGNFRPTPTDARGLDPRGCIETLVDLDHDAHVEALVVTRAPDLGTPPPSVTEPLTLREDGVFTRGLWPSGFAHDEIARREAALEVALAHGETSDAVGLAIELAWIARIRGGDVESVDAALALVSPLALGTEDTERLARARQFLLAAVPSPSTPSSIPPSSASASASD